MDCLLLSYDWQKNYSLFLLFTTINGYSQDSTIKHSDLIYKKGHNWKMNGSTLRGNALKEEIYKVPAAILYYKKAKTGKTIGYLFIAPTVLFAFLGRQNTDITSSGFGKNNVGFKIAGILSGGTGIFFLICSFKSLKKAVSIHNEKLRTVY